MKRNMRTAYNRLKKLGCPVYIHVDDNDKRFSIDSEAPDAYLWADYWASGRRWGFETTNPKIDEILRPLGLFAEWCNPGRLAVFEA